MPPPDALPSSRARSRARALPSRVRLSLSPPFVALPFLLLLCLLCLASSVSAASLASRRLVHPALGDVTAVASYAIDARTVITALGSNDVPSRVHFVAHCDAAGDARHDGAFALPPGVGPARSAAAHAPGYLVLGTAQSPGAIVPAGALTGRPIVLLPGEDVLAAAAALPRATPTSPRRSSSPPGPPPRDSSSSRSTSARDDSERTPSDAPRCPQAWISYAPPSPTRAGASCASPRTPTPPSSSPSTTKPYASSTSSSSRDPRDTSARARAPRTDDTPTGSRTISRP